MCVAAVCDAPEGELHASRRMMEDSLFAWRGPKLAQWTCRLCSLPNSECDPLTLSAESHRFSLIRSDANPNRLVGGKGTRGAEEARNKKGVRRTSKIHNCYGGNPTITAPKDACQQIPPCTHVRHAAYLEFGPGVTRRGCDVVRVLVHFVYDTSVVNTWLYSELPGV